MRSASVSVEQALLVQARVRQFVRSPLGTERELARMSGDSELGLGGRLLEWWSPGREEVLQFESTADSCKKVGSGRLYDHWRIPYLHPIGYLRRIGHVGGSVVRGYDDLTARVDPTKQELGNCDVARADPTEQELGKCDVVRVDPTEQELGSYDIARVDPSEQELGNCDVARVDPSEQELGNYDVARVDPTEQELGNCEVARVDPTEQELRNYDVARVDPTKQELENCHVARVDPTEQELGNYEVARVDPTEQELGNYDVARVDPTKQELGNCDLRLCRGWIRARTLGFGRGNELGRESAGLAEEANSGANLEIWPRGYGAFNALGVFSGWRRFLLSREAETTPLSAISLLWGWVETSLVHLALSLLPSRTTLVILRPFSSVASFEQVAMTSSDSSTSRSDPEVDSSGASSGPPSPIDARVHRDLEDMMSDHDLDTAVTEGSLAVIRERYSIPAEYGLYVPEPGQRPYSFDVLGICISVDALEVGLRFSLHPLIEECLRWWRISPNQVTPNSWRYLMVFLSECRGAGIIPTWDLFMACFRLCKSRGGYYLTAWVDFRVSGAPSSNKGWKVTGGKAPPTHPIAREVDASPAREAPRASSKRPASPPRLSKLKLRKALEEDEGAVEKAQAPCQREGISFPLQG
ncbi:hypothetical protein B296_00048145 [Ensete ventricosum]|uniref:Transposase (putative) gypsy type domain-containing protein n=1 Tax=Ensete ventricosum TaxID=4639 RepID=A0A426XJM2_ENSVE|nr:hypothetical protein B296_00048145 [Ensete ventricosum]